MKRTAVLPIGAAIVSVTLIAAHSAMAADLFVPARPVTASPCGPGAPAPAWTYRLPWGTPACVYYQASPPIGPTVFTSSGTTTSAIVYTYPDRPPEVVSGSLVLLDSR